jgi:membrane fusion protein (multidrug efflux system)
MNTEQKLPSGTGRESPPLQEQSALDAPEPRRRWLRRLLLVLGPVLVFGAGGYMYVTAGRYVETENAYIKADVSSLSAEVSGPITKVLVKENEKVTRGQPLFRIDDAEFRIALTRARARLLGVRAFIQSLKSSYRQKQEELKLARTNADFAEREFQRQSKLARDNLASQSRFDEARHNRDVARRQIAITQEALDQLQAQLGGSPDGVIENHPLYLEAKAAYDSGVLNLDHTVVRAPYDGIAQKTPEPGQYVRAGEPVMAVVADSGMWIEANFKETEVTHVHPGQQVTIHVDTYPDRTWQGTVTSLSRASGAEFSVLPPQNATGNWVKVVQRIPIRIAINTGPDAPTLRAGMSTTVTIDTGYQRPLPGIVRTVLNWLPGMTVRAAAVDGDS